MYPVMLNLENKKALVIGGGETASRKIESLLTANAEITVLSPKVTSYIKKLIRENSISFIKRVYKKGDLKGFFIVIASTNNRQTNIEIYKEAAKLNLLINVVDIPELCNFFVPAVVRKKDLVLSISTSGKAPFFAMQLRKALSKLIPLKVGNQLKIFNKKRQEIIDKHGDNKLKKKKLMKKNLYPLGEELLKEIGL